MKYLLSVLAVLGLAFPTFAQEFQVKNTLNVFRVGDREQRVRFYISNHDAISSLLSNTPQYNKVRSDGLKTNSSTETLFNVVVSTPREAGFVEFGENSNWNGVAVNPALVLCATDLLKLVKKIGDKVTVTVEGREVTLFNRESIDEINLFLKPVTHIRKGLLDVGGTDYKLEIGPVSARPRDPALNVQVPFNVTNSECALPTEEALETSLKSAARR